MNILARTFLIASFLSLNISFAKMTVEKNFTPPEVLSKGITPESFQKQLADAVVRKNNRRPSNNFEITDDSMMSPELKKFRERYLKVKSPEELHALILEAEEHMDKSPQDYQFVTAQLKVFKSLRGLVFRMVPMVKKTSATHSMLLTVVKNIASNIKIYFPSNSWDAGFRYITEPFKENGKVVSQFKNAEDFQFFLITDVYKSLQSSEKIISRMNLSNTHVLWDNKFIFGTEAFDDNLARFRIITEADRYFRLAMIHMAMENISMFVAYRLENLGDLIKDEGKLYGIDGFMFSTVEGAPAVKKVEALCEYRNCNDGVWKTKYSRLFTLREKYGTEWTKRAFMHLEQAFRNMKIAWSEEQNLNSNEFFFMNPARMQPWGRQIDKNLENIEVMLKGPTKIRSVFTGETVTVNVPNMYMNPPADLKDLLPNKFDLGSKEMEKDGVKYTNYYWGRAIGWNIEKYKPYLEINSNEDLIRATRVIDQAWGGWFIQLPLKVMVE